MEVLINKQYILQNLAESLKDLCDCLVSPSCVGLSSVQYKDSEDKLFCCLLLQAKGNQVLAKI